MGEIIRVEISKLKRSMILLLVMAGGFFNSLVSFYMVQSDSLKWNELFQSSIHNMMLLTAGPLFAVVASYIVAQEYHHHTINQLFTYPQSRTKILAGKLAVIFGSIIIASFITFLITLLIGSFFVEESLNVAVFFNFAVLHVALVSIQFAMIPFIVLIVILTKSYLPGIALGIIAAFSTGIMGATPAGVYYPWSAATLISYKLLNQLESVNVVPAVVSLLLILTVSLGISIWVYEKRDVHSGA